MSRDEITTTKTKQQQQRRPNNRMLSLLFALLIIAVRPHCVSSQSSSLYGSPCPGVFEYYVQDGVLQYGVLRVQCPVHTDCTRVELHVQLSVGNNVQGYNGDLVLLNSRMQAVQDIIARRQILYKILFPRWYNYPPKVTKVVINDELICSGPPIEFNQVRVLTTINLQHTLKLNVPSNVFQANIGVEPYNGDRLPVIDFNPRPPQKVPQFENHDFDPDPQHHQFHEPNIDIAAPPSSEKPFAAVPIAKPSFTPFTERVEPQIVPDVESHFGSDGLNSDECGISLNTNTLIANGQNVQKGQYPWLVAIFTIKGLGPEFVCGGSLISNKHVLTAGHCLRQGNQDLPSSKVFVRLGEHNIHQWTTQSESRSVGALSVSVHNDYKVMSGDGDVAMITLQETVTFNRFIRPICLWTEQTDLNFIVGQVGTVVGWGKNENNQVITPEPKQISLPVVSQEDCLRSHFTFREITSKRTFCAGYRNGSGPCNGDSGGGFILERNNRWTLRGLVSISLATNERNCDYSNYFVFADITKYMQWIQSNLL